MAPTALATDVVVIGGGIIGCSVAGALAQLGLHPTIVERDSIGSHASGFAFGELLPWWGRGIPGPIYDFGLRCLDAHCELQPWLREQTGIDTGFRLASAMAVAVTEEDRVTLCQRYQWLVKQQAPVRWVDGPTLRSVEPRWPDTLPTASMLIE